MSKVDKALEDLPEFHFPGGIKPRRQHLQPKAPAIDGMGPGWDEKPVLLKRKGEDQEFFTINAMAQALGRKPVTIRSWEDKGWLPPARFRKPAPKRHGIEGAKPRGARLYTREQIEAVYKAARACGVLDPSVNKPNWKKFTKTVVDAWRSAS